MGSSLSFNRTLEDEMMSQLKKCAKKGKFYPSILGDMRLSPFLNIYALESLARDYGDDEILERVIEARVYREFHSYESSKTNNHSDFETTVSDYLSSSDNFHTSLITSDSGFTASTLGVSS